MQMSDPKPQELFFDTKKVENGIYNIAIGVSTKEEIANSPWIALVQMQVIVEN